MRLLSLLFFITVAMLTHLMADDGRVHTKLPLSESLPLLKTIEAEALHMGSGPVKVHVFIDPLCPHSRNFVEMVAESEKMRSRYSYNFYLYTLPRLHSEAMVTTIFASENPMALLLKVMVQREHVETIEQNSDAIRRKIEAIEAVAEKLDVYKRPYMIMVKKPKKKRGQ